MLWRHILYHPQDFGVVAVGIILLPAVLINPGFILSDARKMHLVYWNTSNPLFRVNTPKDLRVSVDDQIAFICPNRVPPTNKVYWTTDVSFYKTCQQPIDHLSLIHLLVDCSLKPPAHHLLIDISVLINQLPPADVVEKTKIYFMAETTLCKFKNMHMNVTVVIPERRQSVPEGRNIALADSANIAQEDIFHIPSPKPTLTDFGISVNPRSSRFIGLLVAYILITLLVVYMVVCAVCFQPRKCLSLVGRDADEESESVSSPPQPQPSVRPPRGRRFTWRWFQTRPSTSQAADMPLVLPRTNPHFSRSVNGERFLHYPVHFRLAPNLPSAAVEPPTENWASSNSPHQSHHQSLRHQRPMLVDAAWNRVNETDPSLPPLGAPISYYD
ncbi:cupredoxin [Echinococcus multilocularis]|uniref:Ephrin n=1 Tax=Echinococcus multilocularis TaxID=6211 RepID=A0A087W106_ECHMU|nr:cupredoxin [Echinococcus multilocularis]